MAGYPSTNPFGTSGLAESATGPARGPRRFKQHAHTNNEPPPKYEHVGGSRTSDEPFAERSQEVQAIAVMGPTGSGKSTLISKLGGSAVNIGHSLYSGTQDIVEVRCKIGDRYVMLVDTPGFNDTVRSDTEILGLLVDWMKDSYGERQFSGIIYLHDISGARMTGSILKNLQMFRKLCGEHNLRNVILATSKWATTPTNDAILRERDLCSDEGFWGLMIKKGSMVRRFDNTTASARSLVEELLHTGSKGFTPKLQREVVEEGKSLSQTAAGAFIDEALARQAKEHKEEMKTLLEEQERARKEHDRNMQEALRQERKRLEKAIEEKEKERRALHLDEMGALKKKFEDLQKSVRRKDARFEDLKYSIQKKDEEFEDLQDYVWQKDEEFEDLQDYVWQKDEQLENLQKSVKKRDKKVEDLRKTVQKKEEEAPRHMNHLGAFHSRWKCLVCKGKTPQAGHWTCPYCNVKHDNVQ